MSEPSSTREDPTRSGKREGNFRNNNRSDSHNNSNPRGGHSNYNDRYQGSRFSNNNQYPDRQSYQRSQGRDGFPQDARLYPQQHHSNHQYHQNTNPPPIRLVPGQPPPFPIPHSAQDPNLYGIQGIHHQAPFSYGQRRQASGHDYNRQGNRDQYILDNQFAVFPLSRFKVDCAPFQQPIEIGSFSYNEKREFIMDDSQLKYYFPPDLTKPNNLSVNYDKYISRSLTTDEHLDALLDALICIRDREDESNLENTKAPQPDKIATNATTTNDIASTDTTVDNTTVDKTTVDNTIVDNTADTDATTTSATITASRDSNTDAQTNTKKDNYIKQPQQPSATKADFVCYRGILTKIMCTPYNRNEPWELRATLYKGTIYIEENATMEKRMACHGVNDRHKLLSYWGYRFETICNISKPPSELRKTRIRKPRGDQIDDGTSSNSEKRSRSNTGSPVPLVPSVKVCLNSDGTPEEPRSSATSTLDSGNDNDDDEEYVEQIDLQDPELTSRIDGIVDTNLQYCTVARTRIGRNSVIMGAEVDCISEAKKAPPFNPLSHYIELKTSRVIHNHRERSNFEKYKLLKFWAQSFLPGIPTIIVGFRDDDGNVVTLETFKTMEIPRLVRNKDAPWDSIVCINFLDGVFNFFRKHIVIDDPEVTYRIQWAAPFAFIQVDHQGKKNGFLTERFLNRWESIK